MPGAQTSPASCQRYCRCCGRVTTHQRWYPVALWTCQACPTPPRPGSDEAPKADPRSERARWLEGLHGDLMRQLRRSRLDARRRRELDLDDGLAALEQQADWLVGAYVDAARRPAPAAAGADESPGTSEPPEADGAQAGPQGPAPLTPDECRELLRFLPAGRCRAELESARHKLIEGIR